MGKVWGSTSWGQIFTSAPPWTLAIEPGALSIVVGKTKQRVPIGAITDFMVTPGLIWASATISAGGHEPPPLDGIPNASAQSMQVAVREAILQEKARHLIDALPEVRAWHASCLNDWRLGRWLSRDMIADWMRRRPASAPVQNLLALRNSAAYAKFANACTDHDQKVLAWFFANIPESVAKRNEDFLTQELDANRDFFNKIESSPLTDEQARAVVCFENRIQLVASAGSGKTSTMVAKAGYALHRQICTPEAILLLAFNTKAAEELRDRIRTRLSAVGLPADAIQAQTFHAFGLKVIGEATKKKPSLAPWLDQGQDLHILAEIVDQLKDHDLAFRTNWDLFRLVFGRSVSSFGVAAEPDYWDPEKRSAGHRTLNGEVVKSQEERMVADWLFYQGVSYQYEGRYKVETATAIHRQYVPDFYYPQIDVYHEHFALDARGEPPQEFTGYADGVRWKRLLHQQFGTTLWETTSHTVRTGRAWADLSKWLKAAGIQLDPNPHRPARGRSPISDQQLVKTVRTFLTHVKSNCLTEADLLAKLDSADQKENPHRDELFISLFLPIWMEWERRLRADNFIDFEDMLNLAAEHVEQGRWTSPYELVLADEFQDASRARARLLRALVNRPHRYLCAVGDDWQSINRFAGADLSVMTKFEQWFGPATRLKLERTFRCPQHLCDVSSTFVQRNPAQIKKIVRSQQQPIGPAINLIEVPTEDRIRSGIECRLHELHQCLLSGEVPRGRNGKVTLSILGRYNADSRYVASHWADQFQGTIGIDFKTVHASKGLEADYIILPRVVSGHYGFPSGIEDDPVLRLAMPGGDDFGHAEERRLFYVALTRARRNVTVVTVTHYQSQFVAELMKDLNIQPTTVDGEATNTEVCPKCRKGVMVPRKSQFGVFYSCSRFPACDQKHNPKRGRRRP